MTSRGGRRVGGDEPAEWLTLGQAAKYLGVAQSTIRKWSDLGRVPAFHTPGGHRRFRRRDLDVFLSHSGLAGREPEPAGPTILIVDDDERLCEYVRANLELEGYVVREARSAEEGLTALEQQPADLVLLDVMLPRVDGCEMLRRVQACHGVGTMPVLMFSGEVDTRALAADARGATRSIGEPFDPRQLIETAKQLLPA